MKAAQALLLLLCTFVGSSAQFPPAGSPFAAAVDSLRASMLKLHSSHKLTAADGVFDYNLSILDVTADAATCTLTWKDKADLTVSSQIHTRSVVLDDILSVNSVSSANSKMVVDPYIQIVQIHMRPDKSAIDVAENFKPDGSPLGTPTTKRAPVVVIFTSSEQEATTIIRQLTALMSRCSVQK